MAQHADPARPTQTPSVPHRKNAAEWVMWVFWFPATRLSRWFGGLDDSRRWALAIGIGCILGGIVQGAGVGRAFLVVGLLMAYLAMRRTRTRNP